ncbi:MAG: TetR/AcrR family transcriptional regulator, partial [Geminicoccaceae bacterium]
MASTQLCCSAKKSSACGKPAPARATRLSAAERETLILDATEKLLAQGGLAGASMAAIARAAGMSKRTLYAVFASREQLFEALVRRARDVFVRPLGEADRARPLAWRLRRLLEPESRESAWAAPTIILRAVVAEAASHPEVARLLLTQGIDVCRELVRVELDHARAKGELACADVGAAASLLCDMAFACPLEQLLDPG